MTAGEVVTRFVADISDFASGIGKMTSQASSFASQMGKHVESVGSGFMKMGKNILGSVESVGRWIFFGKQLVSTGIDMVKGFFDQNAAMEQTRVAFAGLLGGGKQADVMLRQLQAFAASTPFEFPELAKDTQMLIGMGFSAQNVIPIMTAVGDAAAGVGAGAEGVNHITLALGQMEAKGKISGDEMMQMTEAGIPAWKILADSMHLTVAQVMDLSQKGKLGEDAITKLWQGMEKMYGGQMRSQAMTFNGLMSTLHDNAVMALMAFAGPIFDMAKGGLKTLTDLAGSPAFAEFARTMGVQVAGAVTQVVNAIKQTVQWIQDLYSRLSANGTLTAFRDIASSLGQILMNVVNGALLLFGTRLGDIGAKGGSAKSSAQGVADAIRSIAAVITTVVGGLANLTGLFADGGIKGDLFRAALWGVAAAMIAIKVIQIGSAIAGFISLLPTIIGLTLIWAADTWAVAVAMIAATWPVLAIIAAIALLAVGVYLLIRNWGAVVNFLKTVWGAVVTWTMGTLSTLGAWFTDRWNEISTTTVAVWTSIVNFLRGLWNGVVGFIQGVIGAIVGFFVASWTNISTTTQNVWNSIVTFLHTVISAIVGWVGAQFKRFYDVIIAPVMPLATFFGQVFYAIYLIISKLVSMAVAWLVTKWNEASAFTISIWNTVSAFIGNVWNTIYTNVARFLGMIRDFLLARWNEISSFTQSIWNTVSGFIGNIWNTIYTNVARFLAMVRDFILARWNEISAFTTNIWNTVSGFIGNIWNTIYTKVSSAITTVRNFLQARWNEISNTTHSIWQAISNWLTATWNNISKMVGDKAVAMKNVLVTNFSNARDVVINVFRGMVNGIIGALNGGINALRSFLNGIADAINTVESTLGVSGGRVGHVAIGNIPRLARGTKGFAGGMAMVGEQGPELVYLPGGTQVATAGQTKNLLGLLPGFAGGIGDIFSNITGVFSHLTDIGGYIVNSLVGAFHMPGVLSGIPGAIASKLGSAITSFITGLLPKATTVTTGGGAGGTFGTPVGVPGNVTSWILAAMALTGVPGSWLGALTTIAMHESGGNPSAINLWDINAKNGIPSQGLFQTIPPTFAAHALPGHMNILNPIDNAAAAIGYIIGRYGTVFNVPGIASMARGGPYVGYAGGGVITEPIVGVGASGTRYRFGENGPETVIPGRGGGKQTVIQLVVDGRVLASALGGSIYKEVVLQLGAHP
jgi:tape measure domain-containing protein